jgi:hypothetical protein
MQQFSRGTAIRKSHMELGKSLEGDCAGGMLPLVGPCVCEVTHPSLSVRHPTNAVQENGSYGGQGKAAGAGCPGGLAV